MTDVTGMFGWKPFDRNRKDMLGEMDKVLEQIEERPVKTEHGDALEAIIRKWLSEFLPKKYAVTSGYVIPNIYNPGMKLYHSDVIIYNRLEAPVLWTQENADQSEQGKYRAIPAKHIVALYEVKAQMTESSIDGAVDKLCEINDISHEFPENFHSGIIFGYLKESNRNKNVFLEKLGSALNAFGFKNGLILRYDGDVSISGRISTRELTSSDSTSHRTGLPIVKPNDEMGEIGVDEDGNVQIKDSNAGSIVSVGGGKFGVARAYQRKYFVGNDCVKLDWTIDNFANFSIHLLIHLDGNNAPVQNFSFGKMFEAVL